MVPLLGIVLIATGLLSGCGGDVVLMDPKGQIGVSEKNLILTAIGLMLIVVIPVIFMTFLFAWKYRASNTEATYTPDWSHSNLIEIVVWTIPCIIIIALGIVTWNTSHSLDPHKPLESTEKTIVVEAVSLDWKWLFIYPEQGVASVNELAFPVDVPVEFHVSSGSVMNSFFIPQLGSQIYAMAGMQNQVSLIANEKGTYAGISANYSGPGFSDMKFNAIVGSKEDFNAWVQKAKQSPNAMDAAAYNALAVPSEKNPVAYYSSVTPKLFDKIIKDVQNGANASNPAPTTEVASQPQHEMSADMPGMSMNHDQH